MQQNLEKQIKLLLHKNQSKKYIYDALSTEGNRDNLARLLNNLPLEKRRKKTFFVTMFVLTLLILLTTKQFLYIFLHESSNVSFFLSLIAPTIHIFVMKELIFSHKMGYQILPLLSILALFRPENRILPDMYMYLCMGILSGGLYLFLFPKSAQEILPTH